MTQQRVVVAVRGGDDLSRDAVALGVRMARSLRSELVITAVWRSPLGPGDGVYEEAVGGKLERLAHSLGEDVPDDVAWRVVVLGATSAARGVHHVARREDAAMLVVGPSHVHRRDHTLIQDVALAVVHDAPCPVAVACAGLRTHERTGDVVLAWDDSAEAAEALEAAVDAALLVGADLHVVHVVDVDAPYPVQAWFDDASWAAWSSEVRRSGEASVARAEALVDERVPVRSEVLSGSPAEHLVAAAADARMLVMGSRSHGTLHRLVVGSTATAVLRHATCPVMVLPRGSARAVRDDDLAAATTS